VGFNSTLPWEFDMCRQCEPSRRFARCAQGLYCGRVRLGRAGEWELVVRYVGPAGTGKLLFLAAVG
jgi:hypothetical protein